MARKGLLQAMATANRRAERDSVRRYREHAKRTKQLEKAAELDSARQEVELYEAHVEMLVSIHKDCSKPLNWQALFDAQAPPAPVRTAETEDEARGELESYRPGLFARLFGLVEKQRAKLHAAIGGGRVLDDIHFGDRLANHARAMEDWREQREFARRVVEGDVQAYLEVVEEMNPFGEVAELGSAVRISPHDASFVEATVQVNSDSVVPTPAKSLLASGKLSVKALTPAKFNAIYQDYVCGAALRVARELLAILPVDAVDVTATVDGLNTATGRNELLTILSVQVTRRVADGLNFELVDPSDCMTNFTHTMKFTKSGGFEPIGRAAPQPSSSGRGRAAL